MTWEELKHRWSSKRVGVQKELRMLYDLLTSADEEQVRATFDLLLSLDESGLCMILHMVGGQLQIYTKVVLHHRLLWERRILEEVMQETSLWHGLYGDGFFVSLEARLYGERAWNALTDIQQKKVVQASLYCVEVPAGRFMMGALPDDENAEDDETPRHQVILTKGISVCVYPCTQGVYESVMGNNPSSFVGSMRPVENVSWCNALRFCNKLSEREGLVPCYIPPDNAEDDSEWAIDVQWNRSANGYRLLTEAEWEYCARGGTAHLYSGSNDIDEVAWYGYISSGKQTHPVGEKKANAFGLYDMSGNVWEWCWDAWKDQIYQKIARVDPVIEEMSSGRVTRGGAYDVRPNETRTSYRSWDGAYMEVENQGFRFVRHIP